MVHSRFFFTASILSLAMITANLAHGEPHDRRGNRDRVRNSGAPVFRPPVVVRRNHEPRDRFRRDFNFRPQVDRRGIRMGERWANRYNRWRGNRVRPHRPVIGRQMRWLIPMPMVDAFNWGPTEIESVANNLENLAYDMYRQLAQVGAPPYVMNDISQLISAIANYQDGVEQSYDYSTNNLYDLFFVDECLERLERDMPSFRGSYAIQDETAYFRYYVDELLALYNR